MRKVVRWAFVSVAVLIASAIAAIWMVYQAARQEPKFYQEALKVETTRQVQAKHEFEHEVLDLRNDVRTVGTWQANFNAEQINAWLTLELPGKFPDALPAAVQDPRVAIEPGVIRAAARFQDESLETVFSFALEAQLTDETNVLAVRIRDVKAGALPLPVTSWLPKIQAKLQQSKLNVRWSQSDGDPVALIQIPANHPEKPNQMLVLDSVDIEAGSVQLAGRTGSAASLGLSDRTQESSIVQRRPDDSDAVNKTTQR